MPSASTMPSIRIFDKELKLIADIDGYAELYYTRKLVEPGDFAFSMPLSVIGADTIALGNFVLVGDNGKRVGIIERVEKKRSGGGTALVIARGHEAKALLGRRILLPPEGLERLTLSGTAEYVMKALVTSQCGMAAGEPRRLPRFSYADNLERGDEYSLSSRISNLLGELCHCARATGIGFSISFDALVPGLVFDVLLGTDRSAEQAENPRALIAEGYDTMQRADIQRGSGGFCNIIYVEGTRESGLWPLVPAWERTEPSGVDRFERGLDAPLLQTEPDLIAYGLGKLASYRGEFFLEAEIMPTAPVLPDEDYFLGDTCSVETYGEWYRVPLESIEERWTKEGPGIRLGFGQPALGSHSTMMRETESLWEMLRSG